MNEFLSSFAPAVFNGMLGSVQNAQNLANTREAQERANQFASMMMQRAYDMNSPSSQVKSFMDAGMNPNLVSGQSFIGATAPQNQGIPNYSQQSPWQLPTDDVSAVAQKRAGAKLANEQALSENSLRAGNIRLQDSLWKFQLSQFRLNDAQTAFVSKDLFRLDETIRQIRQQARLYEEQWKYQRSQNEWFPKVTKAQVDNIISSTAQNYAQRQYLQANAGYLVQMAIGQNLQNSFYRQTWNERKTQLWRDLKIQGLQIGLMSTQNGITEFNFGQLKTFGQFERALGVANSILDVVRKIQQVNPIRQQIELGGSVLKFLNPLGQSSSMGLTYPNASSSFSW